MSSVHFSHISESYDNLGKIKVVILPMNVWGTESFKVETP